MKKYLLISILFISVIGSLKSQVYRYIPDSAFRTVLQSYYLCPFHGDSLDITSPTVTLEISINVANKGVHSMKGIEYFTNINYFDCSYNEIDSFESLPPLLRNINCSYNHLTKLPALPSGLTTLNCNYNNLRSLPTLPNSLLYFYCENNNLDSLPALSTSMLWLFCTSNNLTTLPALPPSIHEIHCSYNHLTGLPTLPITIASIEVAHNLLASLPVLTHNIERIDVTSNNLTVLPSLPDTLGVLYCGENLLTSLPSLPYNLWELLCDHNHLTYLPPFNALIRNVWCGHNPIDSIPDLTALFNILDCSGTNITRLPLLDSLLAGLYCDSTNIRFLPSLPVINFSVLSCRYTGLDSLPELPVWLSQLNCSHNNLTAIPAIPLYLNNLDCSYNDIGSLPVLPYYSYSLNCSYNPHLSCLPYISDFTSEVNYEGTAISCLPNIVTSAIYTPPIGSHPICKPSSGSCPWYVTVAGRIYLDADMDCSIDTSEHMLSNITVLVSRPGLDDFMVSSDSNGWYSADTFTEGLYVDFIDTTELPFFVSCPVSGYDTVSIDTSGISDINRNFALQLKTGFDLGTIGLVNTSGLRPATEVNFDLHTGDMAQLYGVRSSSVGGKIIVDYSGPLHFTGISSGTLSPDTILPFHLVWNISDFSTLDFYDAIKPKFFIDSSARAGDLVCFTTSVSPIDGDRVPVNNISSQCFNVRASYDPNIKEVSPSGSVTSTEGWMYYSIHFQNTGSSYAQNVYVWDTIDANLNLNSIQDMGSSHNQFMEVYPTGRAVKFNFININLQDSTTNEPLSHGYVQYRIKLKDSLSEGTNIQNTASILFDLNAPVITNTTSSRICNTPSQTTQQIILGEGTTEVIVGSHHYTNTGIYTDIFSNVAGCDSVVTTKVDVLGGINDISNTKILFYPNPANTTVLIQIEGIPNAPLIIFDMYGRKVFDGDIISNKYLVNTESFIEGTYIIQCGLRHEKLVVKH